MVEMVSVTEVALTELPLVGLKLQLASDGRLLWVQVYVRGRAVVGGVVVVLMKPPVPATVIATEAAPPAFTE